MAVWQIIAVGGAGLAVGIAIGYVGLILYFMINGPRP